MSKELREKWGKLVHDARTIQDAADVEKRALNADQQKQFDTLMDEAEQVESEINNLEGAAQRAQRLKDVEERAAKSQGVKTEADGETKKPGEKVEKRDNSDPYDSDEYRSAFGRYLKGGQRMLSNEEHRALQADLDTVGGYLRPPTQMVNELIKFVDNMVFMRGISRTFQVTSAESMGAPSLDNDPAAPIWTTEILTGDADSTMSFGKRELHPHPLAKRIKVSRKLLQVSTLSVEELVSSRMAYQFAITEEQAFMTGSGASQPLGVFTASDNGISTGRDVSTDNTSTAITADGLMNAKYSLKSQYQATSRWIFHRTAIRNIRKLKDGNGQYLWQPGLTGGQPASILDSPYFMSEYAPSTFTSGLYVGIIGDFSNYWIADCVAMQMQRLDELYAETAQVGFIARMEIDGMPVLEEAFARVKLG